MSNQESMHQEATINQSQEADVIIYKIAELSQALEENNPSIATYAKVIRGLSQLKNIDLEWKTKDNNYYLRVKAEVLRKTKEGYLVLKVSLVDSIKYRNGIL